MKYDPDSLRYAGTGGMKMLSDLTELRSIVDGVLFLRSLSWISSGQDPLRGQVRE
jgi:hypothetical protein